MFFDETDAESYSWTDGVYILQEYDPVQGGEDGISNTQARALAIRTRNLHNRVTQQEKEIADLRAALTQLTKTTTQP